MRFKNYPPLYILLDKLKTLTIESYLLSHLQLISTLRTLF